MGKFDKAKNKFNEVKIKSNEQANEKKVIWIEDDLLIDHPLNQEDIEYIDDLVANIKSQGFSYELTVTKYGAPEGKYYIVSGHRRRKAAHELGYTEYPCIVKDYASDADVYEAILTGNGTRNTDRDPFCYSTRYMQWEKLLTMQGFTGSMREEIAKRLGCHVRQADKYKVFSKLIEELKDLVREGKCGREPLLSIANKSEDVQREFFDFICNNFDNYDSRINSKQMQDIINEFNGIDKTVNTADIEYVKDKYDKNSNSLYPEQDEENISVDCEDETDIKEVYSGNEERINVVYETEADTNEVYFTNEEKVNVIHEIEGHNDTEKMKAIDEDIKNQVIAKEYRDCNDETSNYKEKEEITNGKSLYNAMKNASNKFDYEIEFATIDQAADALKLAKDLINSALCFMEEIGSKYILNEVYRECMESIKDNVTENQ